MITQIERSSLPASLSNVISKTFTKEPDTGRVIVKVKDHLYAVHKNFRLFLSTSSNINSKGESL